MRSPYQHIKFEDLSYREKRVVYRKYFELDEIRNQVTLVATKIHEKLSSKASNISTFKIDFRQICNYLIEGFLTFEVICDDIVKLEELDIATMIPSISEEGKSFWHQLSENENRVLLDDQVIVIVYRDVSNENSYIETVNDFGNVTNTFIDKHVENLFKVYDKIK